MDPGSINEKLLQNVQRAQTEQLAQISKFLGLKTGSQFVARVQQVTQATPAERAEIIKSIDATLAQLNKNSAAPATKALIDQLTAQKQLLQEPALKLANLNVNPQVLTSGSNSTPIVNTALQNLLIYTNQPMQTGQALLLKIADASSLQILQPLSPTQLENLASILQRQGINLSALNGSASTTQLKEFAAQIARLDLNKLATESTNTKQTANAVNENARAAISETLRNLLPQKDSGQDLLANLPKVAQFIQQLPIAQRKEWLPNQIQDALKTLANHIRISDQLSNPKMLAMTLNNNGQSFENKLAQSVQLPAAQVATTNAVNNLLTPKNAMQQKLSAIAGQPINNPSANIDKIIAQDMKGTLLGLLHQLDTEITKASTPSLAAIDLSKTTLANALPQFLGLLTNKQYGELNQKQLRTQLIMLMHQYTLGTLGKIQLQQIHSVSQQLNQADVAQPNQSWQFEIPVRHGQDVQPLQIHMEQQWIEEQQENNKQKANRVRQWNVMLNFDLPIVGKFYAQLGLLGNNLNAKFWAENENTLAEARQKMDSLTQQLEQEGIQVTHIQCIPGLPPKPKMLLSYSLVDIKT